MKHDLIWIRHTGFWVCKCGESGRTEKTMLAHKQVIADDQMLEQIETKKPKKIKTRTIVKH